MIGKTYIFEENKNKEENDKAKRLTYFLKQISKYPPNPQPDFWEKFEDTLHGPDGTL